ncbi:MAG: tetratricopeptide repeat protein [Bryobacteraceae bacterium]
MFGASHPDIVTCLQLLSQIVQREGKPDEARKLAEDAHALATTLFVQDSPAGHPIF